MTTPLPALAECRDCSEPIRFVQMEDTGRAMPVNPMPNPDGNVAARLAGGRLYGFVVSQDRRPGPTSPLRFVAHFAVCEARARAPKSRPREEDEALW